MLSTGIAQPEKVGLLVTQTLGVGEVHILCMCVSKQGLTFLGISSRKMFGSLATFHKSLSLWFICSITTFDPECIAHWLPVNYMLLIIL